MKREKSYAVSYYLDEREGGLLSYLWCCYSHSCRRKTGLIEYCQVCADLLPTFKVPKMGGYYGGIHFCYKCGEFVSKKSRLYKSAVYLPADVYLSSGNIIKNHDVSSCNGEPIKVVHCGVNMKVYYQEPINDGKILVYECPRCFQEKLLEIEEL